jgi:tetratricopeptide (TPR) repeat protein
VVSRSRLVLLLAFALWLQAAARDYTASPGYAAYQRANALLRAGELNASSAAIQEALRLDPKLIPALQFKSRLAMLARKFDVAQILLQRAISIEPSSWYSHFLYGFQFYLQNQLPQALPELEQARRLDSAEPMPALYLAMTHESLGHPDQAFGLYTEAVKLEDARNAPQASTLLAMARFLIAVGRNAESRPIVDRALALEPNSRDAHYHHARLLLDAGDGAGAAQEGETALRLKGTDVTDREIRYTLLRAYRLADKPAEAARQAEALRSDPGQQQR